MKWNHNKGYVGFHSILDRRNYYDRAVISDKNMKWEETDIWRCDAKKPNITETYILVPAR